MAKTLNVIGITDFSGGIIYNPSGYKDGKDNQYSEARGFTPFVNGYFQKYGALNAGYGFTAFTDSGGLINSYPVNGAFIGGNILFNILGNGKIVKSQSQATVASHTPDSAVYGWDIIPYSHNVAGTYSNRIMYIYDTASASYLGTTTSDLATYNNTLGALTYGVPHRALIGEDGILYITNGNFIAAFIGFEGSDGTFNPTFLKIPSNMTAVGLANYYGNLMILCNTNFGSDYVGKSYVIPYQFGSNLSTTKYELTVGNATAILANGRDLLVWSGGCLQVFNGYSFDIIYENIGTPSQNQVFIHKSIACWVRGGSGIAGYGELKNITSKGLHIINSNEPASGGWAGIDPVGTVIYLGGATSVLRLDTTKFNGNRYFISKIYSLPYKSVLKYLVINFLAFDETLTFQINALRGTKDVLFDNIFSVDITPAMLENYHTFRMPLNVEADRIFFTFSSYQTTPLGIDNIMIFYEPGTDELATF